MVDTKVQYGSGRKLESRTLKEGIQEAIDKVAEEQLAEFAQLLQQNIILQLKMLPSGTSRNSERLAEEIAQNVHVKTRNENGQMFMTITIDHPMAEALDVGTGIYGPRGQPITPTNHRYMFIPETELTNGVYNFKKKFGRAVGRYRKQSVSKQKKKIKTLKAKLGI